MAVGTPDLALGDFIDDCGPRVSAMGQPVDFVAVVLGIHVVKIKHKRITLAAVDACLARQVAPYPFFERAPSHLHSPG